MKRFLAALFAIFILSAFVPALSAGAAPAPPTTRDVRVYLYEKYPSCSFIISWENADEHAVVLIETPKGIMINTTSSNSTTSRGQITVNVGEAESGYWTVHITGMGLGAVNVSGGSRQGASQKHIIKSFTAEANGGEVVFRWSVSTPNDSASIHIYAYSAFGSGNTVWNDYRAPITGSAAVSVNDFRTGLYSFTIEAYDGSTQDTLSLDEAVYICTGSAPEPLEEIKVGSVDGTYYATWKPVEDYSYSVVLYEGETLKVISEEHIYDNYYTFSLPENAGDIQFSAAGVYGGEYGKFTLYPLSDTQPEGEVKFPDAGMTRDGLIPVSVECPDDVTVGVYLDRSLMLENEPAGTFDLTLSEGTHDITVFLTDASGNIRTFSKAISVDSTPPEITLRETGKKTAADHIIIEGSTEVNSTVSINGVEQKLENGRFTAKVALKKGVNSISVTAYDAVGNKSVQVVTVERTSKTGVKWILTATAAAVTVILLTGWYIFLNGKKKGANTDENGR